MQDTGRPKVPQTKELLLTSSSQRTYGRDLCALTAEARPFGSGISFLLLLLLYRASQGVKAPHGLQ
jgi:hypothetical protein